MQQPCLPRVPRQEQLGLRAPQAPQALQERVPQELKALRGLLKGLAHRQALDLPQEQLELAHKLEPKELKALKAPRAGRPLPTADLRKLAKLDSRVPALPRARQVLVQMQRTAALLRLANRALG